MLVANHSTPCTLTIITLAFKFIVNKYDLEKV